jgi:hypothetical protein
MVVKCSIYIIKSQESFVEHVRLCNGETGTNGSEESDASEAAFWLVDYDRVQRGGGEIIRVSLS